MYNDEAIVGTRVELKYCECCGGIWLRKPGSEEVLCRVCAEQMRDLPANWPLRMRKPGGNGKREARPRLPKRVPASDLDLLACAALAAEGQLL